MILTIDLSDLQLKFRVLDTPVADLWVKRMALRESWPMDDLDRFYGFNGSEKDQRIALEKIQECVAGINAWRPLITRSVNTVYDQDTLNYLHNIFEQWHGLLDTRNAVPEQVRQWLSQLNISVHRCESVARGNRARFVCTWFGMPKVKTLPLDLMQAHGTLNPKFGTVCLNYAEIGKTLEDLAHDRDNYIDDSAFRPFCHYSADFVVRMHEETVNYMSEKLVVMQEYYNQHKDFFFDQGFTTFQDPRLLPLRFPVAELIETVPRDQLIQQIAQRQYITRVSLE